MQPIDPAIGGGRLRLLGLYHALGAHLPTTYLGTYDWPGPGYRDHQLTATLREIDVPLSDRHFAAADDWRQLAGGKTVIDVSFPLLAHHSPEFVKAARAAVCDADIVVFSHPWVYPLIGDVLGRREQLVVYDAHNVESVLRYRLLADSEIGLRIVRNGTAVERELCRRADLVLTCSHEDRELFHRLYEIPFGKCLVMPNGTFVGEPPDRVGAPRQKAPVGAGRQAARSVPRQPVSAERGSGGLHLHGTGAELAGRELCDLRRSGQRDRSRLTCQTRDRQRARSPASWTTRHVATYLARQTSRSIRCSLGPAPTSRCSISWRPGCR